jgi:hypothetical protein
MILPSFLRVKEKYIGDNIQKNNIKLDIKESKYSMYTTEVVMDTEVRRSFINSTIRTIPAKNTGTTCH